MPMVNLLPAGLEQPVDKTVVVGEQRAVTDKIHKRRRWIIRTAVQVIVLALALCLLVIWQRDRRAVQAGLARYAKPVAALQASLDRWRFLPAYLPELEVEELHYADDSIRYYAMKAPTPVIIAYGKYIDRFLGEDGRGAIVYETDAGGRGKVSVKWMTASEFRRAWLCQVESVKNDEKKRLSTPPQLP